MKRLQLETTEGGGVVSMSQSWCWRFRVVALAVVLGVPLAAAHGAGPTSSYSAVNAGAGTTAQGEPVSVEDLGHGVVEALRQGSFEALVPYLPTEEDLHEVIAHMVEVGEMTEEQALQNTSSIPAIIEELHPALSDSFAEVQAMGSHYEVSWDAAEITGYRVSLRDSDRMERREVDLPTLAAMDADQMLAAQIHVLFAAAGNQHELNLGDCVRTSRGWVVMERLGWSEPQR